MSLGPANVLMQPSIRQADSLPMGKSLKVYFSSICSLLQLNEKKDSLVQPSPEIAQRLDQFLCCYITLQLLPQSCYHLMWYGIPSSL
jgi:hypothetical protein